MKHTKGLLSILLVFCICILQGCGQNTSPTANITQVTISENEIESSVSSSSSDSDADSPIEEAAGKSLKRKFSKNTTLPLWR